MRVGIFVGMRKSMQGISHDDVTKVFSRKSFPNLSQFIEKAHSISFLSLARVHALKNNFKPMGRCFNLSNENGDISCTKRKIGLILIVSFFSGKKSI